MANILVEEDYARDFIEEFNSLGDSYVLSKKLTEPCPDFYIKNEDKIIGLEVTSISEFPAKSINHNYNLMSFCEEVRFIIKRDFASPGFIKTIHLSAELDQLPSRAHKHRRKEIMDKVIEIIINVREPGISYIDNIKDVPEISGLIINTEIIDSEESFITLIPNPLRAGWTEMRIKQLREVIEKKDNKSYDDCDLKFAELWLLIRDTDSFTEISEQLIGKVFKSKKFDRVYLQNEYVPFKGYELFRIV